MSNQLVKKNPSEGYQNVFPKTFIDAIKDKESGVSLQEILQGFNMYFLSYNGSRALTRCKVPSILRKEGLWITYVLYDHTVVTEWYNSDQIDDNSWSMDSNWRVASNNLVGDVSVSADGYWVINGEKTEAKAQGESGITPLIRIGANNKLQVSYNNGKGWKDISNSFTNNFKISRYIGINDELPTTGVAEGTIYMKGPYYDENDALNENPIYRMWVYAWNDGVLAWQDNGEFQSIAAGVVQEIGNSETEVMSQKAVTEKLSELSQKTSERLGYNLGNDLVFYKNTLSSISSLDDYPALIYSADYDCFMIKVKEGVDVKVTGAIPAQYIFYSSLPIKNSNSGYIKYNTSGKSVEGAKYCVINFRHSENEDGYENLKINTDYTIQNLEEKILWKIVYVELSSRIADEINALPEGTIFLNTYSNTLGIRTGESGWKDHEFAKNELYIINDIPYYFNGTGLVSLANKVDWSDKKWVCVGDSLTEINGRTTKHYFNYISEATGISVINMGVGGTGYKDESMGGDAFYQRILDIDTGADVVTIFGSGNDLSHPLGEITDTGIDTICGCINKTIDNLFQVFPLANLGIITPTPWGWYPPHLTDNKMAKYSQALVDICNHRGIPCLDLYHCSGLRPWDESYLPLCYSKDDGNSVHPDENGHKIIASKIQHFVESLLLH